MKIPIEVKKLDILTYIKQQAAQDHLTVSEYCSGIIAEAVLVRRAAELRHDQLRTRYQCLDECFSEV